MRRPQTPQEMVEECHRLIAQVSNPDEDEEIRLNAAKIIFDRAGIAPWSRAKFEDMTVDELEARLARARAELASRGEPVD